MNKIATIDDSFGKLPMGNDVTLTQGVRRMGRKKYRVEWLQDRQWVYELCETADEAKSLLSRLPAICRVDSKIIPISN